ncbi:MAG: hypothetical protein HY898_24105 [Deltaproteobacteria bacterium]|nr:hypothetical protein [Deltaproteobacteria bacterium]
MSASHALKASRCRKPGPAAGALLLAVPVLTVWACSSDEAQVAGPWGTTDASADTAASDATSGKDQHSEGAAGTGGAQSDAMLLDGPDLDAPAANLVRIGDTFEIPTVTQATPKRTPDVAYDPLHDVYVVVHGNNTIGGAFVSADGAPVGAPFQIQSATAWAQAPRIACEALQGICLVTWHDAREDPNSPRVWARALTYDNGSPKFLGPDFRVNPDPSYQENAAAVAWSAASQEFLVVWQKAAQSDIRAQRVAASGTLLGGEMTISSDADWQGEPAVACSEASNECFIAHTHADAVGAKVVSRRVQAGSGTLLGDPVTLAEAKGTWVPNIAYLPWTGGYFVGWWQGELQGRFVQADGAPSGTPLPIAVGYGAYDGFSMALHAASGTFGAVFHGTTDEDWAAALSPSGATGAVIEATQTPGTEGNFNPRIAAHAARREWLIVTSTGFAKVAGQRVGIP